MSISDMFLHCQVLDLMLVTHAKASKNGLYVNMTDIVSGREIDTTEAAALVELLFFCYRDFVADADELLESLAYGRAHHRVLHFVGRDPGMTVAQLLEILKITKQSLSPVLRDLIEKGHIQQVEGKEDRRQRLLYLTADGKTLWERLIAPQISRFRNAEMALRPDTRPRYHELLYELINPGNRETVRSWIERVSIVGATKP
jgi:DNA-binding MarR family transcriptional regulator